MSENQRASRQRWAAQQRRGRLRPRTDGRRGQRRAMAKVAEQRRARAEKMRRSMVFSVGIYLPIIKSLGKKHDSPRDFQTKPGSLDIFVSK